MWSVLLSSLRPARRHAYQLKTALCSNKLIGSRGYTSSSSTGDNTDTTKRDLYVVLADNKDDGFGIHKLDLGFDVHDLDAGMRRLPEPPIFRVTLETLGSRVQFAAVGSSIVAIGTPLISPELKYCYIRDIGGILIYNTKTAALTVAPYLPTGLMHGGYNAAMAIGNRMYMLGSQGWQIGGGSLHCLTADPVDIGGDKFWGWDPLSDSSPWCWSNFFNPPRLPFSAKHITAHAVHALPPAGATEQHEILVSVRPTGMSATFSFNTASRKWRHRGQWHLPVIGQAYYDDQLDAWVGLHAGNDGTITDGHLCVGNVTSAPSDWKVGKQKLFRRDEDVAAGWKHVDAKLVSTASSEGRNEYCLMERLHPEGEEEDTVEKEEDSWGDGGKCLLRLTCFRVERGQDGEPMALTRWPPRSYEVRWHNRHFDAQVFWV